MRCTRLTKSIQAENQDHQGSQINIIDGIVAYVGHKIQAKGNIMLVCQHKDKEFNVEFEVFKNKAPACLGAETGEEMCLVKMY